MKRYCVFCGADLNATGFIHQCPQQGESYVDMNLVINSITNDEELRSRLRKYEEALMTIRDNKYDCGNDCMRIAREALE